MKKTDELDRYAAEVREQWRQNERAEIIARYKRLNKMVRKGQILFSGSSLMGQFPIHELLVDLDLPLAIYNRGVSGFTTVETQEHLDTLVFDLEPAHIFINIGTNDLNAVDYRQDVLIQRYDDILGSIRQRLPEAGLYVLAYYPCNPIIVAKSSDPGFAEHFGPRTNQRVREANQAVKSLAQKHSAVFLDLNSNLTDEEGNLKEEYTMDGIHMYADGYMQVLQQLIPILKDLG